MGNDTFVELWNDIGNPDYKSFVTYVRNSIDRTIYAVYKNPTNNDLDTIRKIEKKYVGITWGFRYGIYKSNKYVWSINGTHVEVQKNLLKIDEIQGDWEQIGELL